MWCCQAGRFDLNRLHLPQNWGKASAQITHLWSNFMQFIWPQANSSNCQLSAILFGSGLCLLFDCLQLLLLTTLELTHSAKMAECARWSPPTSIFLVQIVGTGLACTPIVQHFHRWKFTDKLTSWNNRRTWPGAMKLWGFFDIEMKKGVFHRRTRFISDFTRDLCPRAMLLQRFVIHIRPWSRQIECCVLITFTRWTWTARWRCIITSAGLRQITANSVKSHKWLQLVQWDWLITA